MRDRDSFWHPPTWDLSRSQLACAALGTVPLIWWSINYWTGRKPRHAGPTDFNNFLKVPAAGDSACEWTSCLTNCMAVQAVIYAAQLMSIYFRFGIVESLNLDQRLKGLLKDACDAVICIHDTMTFLAAYTSPYDGTALSTILKPICIN